MRVAFPQVRDPRMAEKCIQLVCVSCGMDGASDSEQTRNLQIKIKEWGLGFR
jgi:hypothetical protein